MRSLEIGTNCKNSGSKVRKYISITLRTGQRVFAKEGGSGGGVVGGGAEGIWGGPHKIILSDLERVTKYIQWWRVGHETHKQSVCPELLYFYTLFY